MHQRLLIVLFVAAFLLITPPVFAAELRLSSVSLSPCDSRDPGSQPSHGLGNSVNIANPEGASCYVLRGIVDNPNRRPLIDTDIYARILDRSGEPVLANRTRVGSIGDVEPGSRSFALRVAIPTGTPGPFVIQNPRARGFNAPVRSRANEDEELLPLERSVVLSTEDLA